MGKQREGDLNMSQNQNYDDEIDLKELLLVLWRKKVIIISLALVGAILGGLLSIFVITPVYNTDLKIDLNMPETYTTKYGEYKLPVSTNAQYLKLIISSDVIINTMKTMGYVRGKDMSISDLRNKIALTDIDYRNANQNVFDVRVSAKSSEESLKLAKALYDNYIEYVDMATRDRAVNYFYDNFNATLKAKEILLESTKNILQDNEGVLKTTPETLNQGNLANRQNATVIEDIINPAYKKLQESIVDNKELIITTEDEIRVLKQSIAELEKERTIIEDYYKTGNISEQSSIINIAKTNIYLLSSPVAPDNKTSPSNVLNALIGLFLGGILAVGIVLVREYWLKKE